MSSHSIDYHEGCIQTLTNILNHGVQSEEDLRYLIKEHQSKIDAIMEDMYESYKKDAS